MTLMLVWYDGSKAKTEEPHNPDQVALRAFKHPRPQTTRLEPLGAGPSDTQQPSEQQDRELAPFTWLGAAWYRQVDKLPEGSLL